MRAHIFTTCFFPNRLLCLNLLTSQNDQHSSIPSRFSTVQPLFFFHNLPTRYNILFCLEPFSGCLQCPPFLWPLTEWLPSPLFFQRLKFLGTPLFFSPQHGFLTSPPPLPNGRGVRDFVCTGLPPPPKRKVPKMNKFFASSSHTKNSLVAVGMVPAVTVRLTTCLFRVTVPSSPGDTFPPLPPLYSKLRQSGGLDHH